ncbi:MAG: S-layer homology domain-containing protein [Candidatus Metalachnospira sp.]|nr:S-layer homology domain-containing protein [Candidatus Metalachnospira sp.]
MKKKIIGIIVSAVMAISSAPVYAADETGMTDVTNATKATDADSAGIMSAVTYGKYNDVGNDKWYYNAVEYVSDKNIMVGTSYGYFSPNLYATRGTLAQIIKNLNGESDKIYWSYLDVKENSWYADAIAWCSDAGVMKGYGGGYFGPDDNITREQLVFTLYRFAVYKSLPNLETTGIELLDFSDYKKVSGYAGGAMQWALKNGIIAGKDNKMLDPQGNATRAEIAQMIKNFMIYANY